MSKLKPGIRGVIAIDAGLYKGRYPSMLEDLKDDMLALAPPLLNGVLLPIYRDMDFTFTIEDSTALYIFDMSAWRLEMKDGVPLMWATILDEPRRIQRRQFVRISCFQNVTIFHIEEEQRKPMRVTWKHAKALDISLGGIGLKLDDGAAEGLVFEPGDRLMVCFELLGEKCFLTGRVSKIMHEDKMWKVGMGFDSIAISVERKLFRYIRQQEIMGREVNEPDR
jgi:c-di-GMP-binding flagellar brake protein YcgR